MRDQEIAEDLIREAFLDVWRQDGEFEDRSAVPTWLLPITRFEALSVRRRRKDLELVDEAANPLDDPDLAAQKDTSEALRRCLNGLSQDRGTSSILSTTTSNQWKRWLRSSGYRRIP